MAMRTDLTRRLVLAALFAALTAVCSQLQIPLPMIPINLALFAVYLSGAVLGARWGALAMIAYALLGVIGAPVFVGFVSGPSALFGRTGGYILGYVFAAGITGLLSRRWGFAFKKLFAAMALGTAACYLFGTIWFMILTKMSLASSLSACVLPFLPGDAIKISLAALLALRLRTPLRAMGITL